MKVKTSILEFVYVRITKFNKRSIYLCEKYEANGETAPCHKTVFAQYRDISLVAS